MGTLTTTAGTPLSAVMNDLANGRAGQLAQTLPVRTAVSELDIFLTLDGTLAALHTQYLSARQRHAAVRTEYGIDSPMTDMAADGEDSAWCAMQTRLMELRANGSLMQDVQRRMREAEEEGRREEDAKSQRQALAFYNRMETARLMKERSKSTVIYEWLLLILLLNRHWRLPFQMQADPYQRIAA